MPYYWAWGFKSPLRHHMTRANALVIGIFRSERGRPKTQMSAICQQNLEIGRATASWLDEFADELRVTGGAAQRSMPTRASHVGL